MKKKKYIRPHFIQKKLSLNMFSMSELDAPKLLAICSYCYGDECPPDCSTSCFLSGTTVHALKGLVAIEQIQKGQQVYSYNIEKNKQVINTVEKTLKHEHIQQYLVINNKLKVTPEHRIWTNGKEWKTAGELSLGDTLFTFDGSVYVVETIEKRQETVDVYNIHMQQSPHNYFAGGVLVHNWK